ncbi:hypothetical protein HDU99_007516 [Rhizoclosmatium hyalinum]|nr:hypothetical protein HDU99_007516 [Rhizoclosmatium hyalinum]
MAAFFSQTMPTASRALFDPSSGLPFHVVARLRKWVGPEDEVDESYGFGKLDNRTQPLPKKKSRWSEKGPVVLMILPCSEERPWEARVVAHYTFGIQTAAVNMPISDVHASYLRQLTPKKLILSSLGQNIQAHAIISSQPRRIHDFLSNVSQHDLKVLKNMPKSGDAKHSELTMAVAERLEAVSLDANQMPRRIAAISKSTRAAASIAASASRARESKNQDSGNESSDTSGRVTPEPKSDAVKGKGRKMCDPVAMNPDFILECKSTIVPVKEDSSSVFMFAFDQKDDCTAFTSRFLKAVTDYSAYLTEKRTSTFITPQLVKRVLLSGQTVLLPGSTLCSTSPFAHEPLLARQIAETGLMYLPTLTPDNQVQHRLICTHCHAALAVCTASTCAPGFEAVCSAHAGHSFAKRGGEVVGKGKKAAVADACGAVYWCVYALKWVGAGGSGGLEGCVGNMGKKGWDLVVVN